MLCSTSLPPSPRAERAEQPVDHDRLLTVRQGLRIDPDAVLARPGDLDVGVALAEAADDLVAVEAEARGVELNERARHGLTGLAREVAPGRHAGDPAGRL